MTEVERLAAKAERLGYRLTADRMFARDLYAISDRRMVRRDCLRLRDVERALDWLAEFDARQPCNDNGVGA